MEKQYRRRLWLFSLLGPLVLAAFFAAGVHSSSSSLTTVVNFSTSYIPTLTINSGQTVRVSNITFSIPSGHVGFVEPLTWGANIACTTCTSFETFEIDWYLNGLQVGIDATSALPNPGCSNCGPQTSFGLAPSIIGHYLNNTYSGTVSFYIQIRNIGTPSPITVSYQYTDLIVTET